MSLNIVPLFVRKWFARAVTNSEPVDATLFAHLDAQVSDLVEGHNQSRARLNAISTPAGSLKYALVSINSFTATAGQTAFTVTTYDNTAGASFVLAFAAGVALPQSSITQTSTTVVTLSAQPLNTAVIIAIFAAGNGTSQLASTSAGQGASLIGINDAGGVITATDTEGALQEIATNLASSTYLGSVLTISGYLLKSGGTMSGNIAMGANKITGLAAGTASSNDAARMADITSAALQSALTAYLSATYLPLTGGTVSGNIAFGSNKATGLGAATTAGDAVRYEQWTNTVATYLTSGLIPAARYTPMVGASASASGTIGTPTAPAAGQQDYVWYGDATWRPLTTSIGSGYVLFKDVQATTVAGGAAAAATWNKRTLNTTEANTISGCSITTSVITLPAGTYRVRAYAPAFAVDAHKLKLRNTSDSADTIVGTGQYAKSAGAPDSGDNTAHLNGRFTIAGIKTFELQHYTTSARLTNGLGVPTSDGANEVYATIEIIRE